MQFNERAKERRPNTQEMFDTDYRLIAEFSESSDTENNFDATQPKVDQELNSEASWRSTRQKKQPDFYGKEMSDVSKIAHSPTSYQEATEGPNKKHWEAAMKTEMMSLNKKHVWDLVKLPANKKTVGSKWVFKVKTGEDGSVQRYKARLVAQGFKQKYGADFDKTFCPVVQQESLHLLMALSVQHGLVLHQVDLTTAFLNEEVYMQQPQGFVCQGKKELACKRKKSIYGLKQSPHCWNSTLDTYLKKLGFIQTASDPCIYYQKIGSDIVYIGVHVDDIVLAGKDERQFPKIKDDFRKGLTSKT